MLLSHFFKLIVWTANFYPRDQSTVFFRFVKSTTILFIMPLDWLELFAKMIEGNLRVTYMQDIKKSVQEPHYSATFSDYVMQT